MHERTAIPSLDLLKGFEAVARHLSFTRAAAELFVTQSAVSRQVRQLEEQLGVRLFERRTRAVVLTEEGHRFYAELEPLLQQLGALTQKFTAIRSAARVRVTATLTFSALWLVPRLTDFQEKHPDVEVHIVADNVVRDLVRDGFDVAIRYGARGIAGAAAEPLFGETLTPVCSPELLGKQPLASPRDLDHHVLIHFNDLEGRAPWLSWDAFFTAIGWTTEHPRGGAVHFSHYDQAIRAARAGQGVALGRFPVVDRMLADGGLVAPLRTAAAQTLRDRDYWLVGAAAGSAPREVELFAAWLRAEAQRSARGEALDVVDDQRSAQDSSAVRATKATRRSR